MTYPKRLIEVDLPIKKISEHARREKSIRHGHISTLHIWWARRPLAACRAVICAALWPDPGDPNCPERFKSEVARLMKAFRDKRGGKPYDWNDGVELRKALLEFIADFANWDNSTNRDFLDTSRKLTQVAHESLGGEPGTRPLVVDPFAGGGSIPLEALRVGADTFASDLNPIPVLINKVTLEYISKYGQKLADEVRKWGGWLINEVKKELSEFYPKDPDGSIPIAYLWARTIRCEGPNCGAELPMLRAMWLAKTDNKKISLKLKINDKNKTVDFELKENTSIKDLDKGTVHKGAVVCPICDWTTPTQSVKRQLKEKRGGTNDARLFAVVTIKTNQQGRFYRLSNERDLKYISAAASKLREWQKEHQGKYSLVPNESTEQYHSFVNRGPIYGLKSWSDYFSERQALALAKIYSINSNLGNLLDDQYNKKFLIAIQTCIFLSIDRLLDFNSSISHWANHRETSAATFGRQALAMSWDFCETSPISGSTGSLEGSIDLMAQVIEKNSFLSLLKVNSTIVKASATSHPLPDDSADGLITDPPYYYSIQYSDLSDFFYVWLKRSLHTIYPDLFADELTPKDDEIIVQSPGHEYAETGKNRYFYEVMMEKAMEDGRRVLKPKGIAVIVFAHKSTSGWETELQALNDAGWIITASWPIDTEMSSRVIARNKAFLGSSIHLVCRPRENPDGSLRTDEVGDWRDVLAELPKRIHQWMPRLAKEGVVGADAIFACLGPALEIFSRHSRVEKASGEVVTLKEYLEHVWAAVAKEALNMIFEGAETTGFEEDARLTAMWLWTLSTASANGNGSSAVEEESENEEEDEEKSAPKAKLAGYTLEYDAARKIAQGLGAHLERLQSLVEIKGNKARLLPVAERTRALFGKDEADSPATKKKKSFQQKFDFMKEVDDAEESGTWGAKNVPQLGNTTLDRLHQSMILFAAGRGEALKRFLVEEGVGRDERFWRLAQAFSALYPKNTDEKRWVDGVLARKKGIGL